MYQKTVIITNKSGLHARPAMLFVQKANQYTSEITIAKSDSEKINAKSMLGLLALGAAKGTPVEISAEGPDAEAAVTELAEWIETLDPNI